MALIPSAFTYLYFFYWTYLLTITRQRFVIRVVRLVDDDISSTQMVGNPCPRCAEQKWRNKSLLFWFGKHRASYASDTLLSSALTSCFPALNTLMFSVLFYLIWCSYIFTLLHWLQRSSVNSKFQAKRTMASSTGAQKVQSRHSMRWCKIMSLVTKETQVRAAEVTSVIMLEITQRNVR